MVLGVGRQGGNSSGDRLRTCFFQHLELGLAPSNEVPK